MARCQRCYTPDVKLHMQSNGYSTCQKCHDDYEEMIARIEAPTKKRETKIITLSTPT